MKRMLSVFVLGIAGLAIANASETSENINRNQTEAQSFTLNNDVLFAEAVQDSVKRTRVQPVDLPEAIHTTLSGEEFAGWIIVSAYFVEPEEGDSFYEITLKHEEEIESKVIKISADGKIIS